MSSPIHQSDDLDPALRYAPRWARDRVALAGRPLMPPPALRARRARADFSGDRAMVELQRQLMLDPDAIPEPDVDDARTLKPIVLRLSGVMGLAALIAWGIVSLPGLRKVAEIVPPDLKTAAMTGNPVKPAQAQFAQAALQFNQAQIAAAANFRPHTDLTEAVTNDAPPAAVATKPLLASVAPLPAIGSSAVSSPPAAMPSQPPAAPSTSPAAATGPADARAPQVDDSEIVAMIKRGKALLMSGDIASARLLLRRAADAGNAEAALALGATFDPLIIRRLGAIGMRPDIAQAKQWYQRAAELGSASAESQLAKLEQSQ